MMNKTMTLIIAILAFAAGVMITEVTQPEAKTVAMMHTADKCNSADAIAYHDEQMPETIPMLEPVDCNDLQGKARQMCEQSNKDNAGKPAIF